MEDSERILHLSVFALWDLGKGKGRASTYLPIKGMVDAGYNVVYLTNNNDQPSENCDGICVKHISTPFSDSRVFVQFLFWPITTLLFILRGIALCRKKKPAIIYSHATILAPAAYILSKIFKSKYVLRLYGLGKGQFRPFFFPSRVLVDSALAIHADKYILTNDGTDAEKYAIIHGVKKEKILFIRNGINTKCEYVYKSELRNKYVNEDEYLYLSVSRLSNWKHVDDIILQMPPLLRKGLKLKLLIIGDGPERENLENLIKANGLEDKVILLGSLKQEDVLEFGMAADVFISLNELSSMSNPVFEAMLTKCAVVALDRGTTKDLIKDGINGFLIDNVDELPIVLEKLNHEKIEDVGNRARQTILDEFQTWEERIETELQALKTL